MSVTNVVCYIADQVGRLVGCVRREWVKHKMMLQRHTRSAVILLYLVMLIAPITLVLTESTPVHAATPYSASDVLGQPDLYSRGKHGIAPSASGLSWPSHIYVDSVYHRLFVTDYDNNRVLVYNLDASNYLLDHQADYVLGQTSFTGSSGATTSSTFSSPGGIAFDSVRNLLFVADVGNNRILVFDTAVIINGEAAVNVLGQPDFVTNTANTDIKGFNNPKAAYYDSVRNYLFVSETTNNRVLIFDVGTITDNEDAIHVIGQPDFVTGSRDTNQKGFNLPYGIAYDPSRNYLFVVDYDGLRVLVFDMTTITNNEDAIYVLGQSTFTSNAADTNAKGFNNRPLGIAYDPVHQYLYVSEYAINERVLVFDVSTITNNEDAINVLGQPDFVSGGADTNQKGFNWVSYMAYDATTNYLYVSDSSNNRVLIFDATTLSNNEDAVDLLGQDNYTSSNPNKSFVNSMGFGNDGISPVLDTVHHRLFVTDGGHNCRILVFNLDNNNNLVDKNADYVLGQPDMSTVNCSASASTMSRVGALAYDSVNDRLFAADIYSNCRVMVFDTTTITNGEAAAYALGTNSVNTAGSCDTTQNTFNSDMYYGGLAYDETTQRLYVADTSTNRRVMIFDLSLGITTGMNASYVLGASNFTSVGPSGVTASSTSGYYVDFIIDTTHQRLFMSTYDQRRVLVFDVASITNGEAAVNVLGQSNFTTATAHTTQDGLSGPVGMGYDPEQQLLFVNDDSDVRMLIFDVTAITNGEPAVGIIGASDFVTKGTGNATPTTLYPLDQANIAYDSSKRRMYAADDYNARILIFNFASLTSTTMQNASGNNPYSQIIPHTGTQGTKTFTITAGSLPPGISLNASTGQLSGTPTTLGSYSFTVRLSDDNGTAGTFSDTQAMTLDVVADADGDSILDSIESSSPLGNDINNDSVPDMQQKIVVTTLNQVNNTYISTVVNNCAGGFSKYISKPESGVADDAAYQYPHGLQDFTVNCGTVGATAHFTQYFDKLYDTSRWRYRKYMPTVGYMDITNLVTLSTATVNGIQVTVASYSVTDGSQYDADGLTDGNITDPLGAAVLASSSLANTGLNMIILTTIAGALGTGSVFYSLRIIKKVGR